MDIDISGHVAQAGQITGVVFVFGLELFGRRWQVVKKVHRVPCAQGQACLVDRATHRFWKHPEVGVELALVLPGNDQFARLIGRDDQGDAKFIEHRRDVFRMRAAQG